MVHKNMFVGLLSCENHVSLKSQQTCFQLWGDAFSSWSKIVFKSFIQLKTHKGTLNPKITCVDILTCQSRKSTSVTGDINGGCIPLRWARSRVWYRTCWLTEEAPWDPERDTEPLLMLVVPPVLFPAMISQNVCCEKRSTVIWEVFASEMWWSRSIQLLSYLLKSLSTSYSYFIHVSLYTKNSRKARAAMRVNAIRDTGESTTMSTQQSLRVALKANRV